MNEHLPAGRSNRCRCGLSLPSGGFCPREESDDSKIRLLSLNPQIHPPDWLGTPCAGLCSSLQTTSMPAHEAGHPKGTWRQRGIVGGEPRQTNCVKKQIRMTSDRGLQKWQDHQSLQKEERPPLLRTWVVKGSAHNSMLGEGSPQHHAALGHQPDVPQFTSILRLSAWRQYQIPNSKGSAPQGCPCPDFTHQSQVGPHCALGF